MDGNIVTCNHSFYVGIGEDFATLGRIDHDEKSEIIKVRYPQNLLHHMQRIEYAINEASLTDINYSVPCVNISLALPTCLFLATTFTVEDSFHPKIITNRDIQKIINKISESYNKLKQEYIVDIHFGESIIDDNVITNNPINIYGSKIKLDITVISIDNSNWITISSIARRNKFIITDCYPIFLAKALNFYRNYTLQRRKHSDGNILFIEFNGNSTEFCVIGKMNVLCLDSVNTGYSAIVNKLVNDYQWDMKESIKVIHSLGNINANNYKNSAIVEEKDGIKITVGDLKKKVRNELENIFKSIRDNINVKYSTVIIYDYSEIIGLDIFCAKIFDVSYVTIYNQPRDDKDNYSKIHTNYLQNKYKQIKNEPKGIIKKKISQLCCFLDNIIYN